MLHGSQIVDHGLRTGASTGEGTNQVSPSASQLRMNQNSPVGIDEIIITGGDQNTARHLIALRD